MLHDISVAAQHHTDAPTRSAVSASSTVAASLFSAHNNLLQDDQSNDDDDDGGALLQLTAPPPDDPATQEEGPKSPPAAPQDLPDLPSCALLALPDAASSPDTHAELVVQCCALTLDVSLGDVVCAVRGAGASVHGVGGGSEELLSDFVGDLAEMLRPTPNGIVLPGGREGYMEGILEVEDAEGDGAGGAGDPEAQQQQRFNFPSIPLAHQQVRSGCANSHRAHGRRLRCLL